MDGQPIAFNNVVNGYGPEACTFQAAPKGHRYRLKVAYMRRASAGYAMGKVSILEHDGAGGLRFDERPFVLMNESGGVDLGAFDARPGPLQSP